MSNKKIKLITNDELIASLPLEDQMEIKKLVEEDIAKYWGGKRENSGRKPKDSAKVLKFQVRVSQKEKEFLKYAREHNLNYDELMQM